MKPPIEFRPSKKLGSPVERLGRSKCTAKRVNEGPPLIPIAPSAGLTRRQAGVSASRKGSKKTVDEVPPAKTLVGQSSGPQRFNKTAYQREYMRRYRAKAKVPK